MIRFASYIIGREVSAAAALAAAAVMLCAAGQAAAADLLGVRFGVHGDKTRIVFDLDGASEWRVSGDGEGEGRLIVDFATLSIGAGGLTDHPGQGHIDHYRYAPSGAGSARFIFDFKKTAKIGDLFMLFPSGDVKKHRLVVDLNSADKKTFIASLPTPYQDLASVIESATAEPKAPTTAPDEFRPVVVIDAGHGGDDPGAPGQNGAWEKDVTLAAAQELAELLKAGGRYEVVLTRDADAELGRDKRTDLDKRIELAREAKADLFVSLHADAHNQKSVRGTSVYTLSDKGTKRSARESRGRGDFHNVYDLDIADHPPEVGGILYDLAQRTTMTESSKFADYLIRNLAETTPLLNNTHRTADYRVLLAPDVPAVLLELGFLSNKKDEANLTSKVWRKRTMTAVAGAIDNYFDGSESVRHAARRAALRVPAAN